MAARPAQQPGSRAGGSALEVEARPPSPFLMPHYGSPDRVMRAGHGVLSRLMHLNGAAVLVRAWQPSPTRVLLRAEPLEPGAVASPCAAAEPPHRPPGREDLAEAVQRMRFALGVDDDLGDFYRRFRRDPLLGPLLRRRPYLRPRRQPFAWEALAWAIVKQLIESDRAARIQRRIVGRWGLRLGADRGALRDVPAPSVIAGRAPAELESMGLALKRAIALRAVAADIAAGRCDPGDPGADARFLRVPSIGPWTVQCLGLYGRGDPDSLPAGDLIYLKLVGRLARLGRRATVEEVEEFYAPYRPYRGLAASWTAGI